MSFRLGGDEHPTGRVNEIMVDLEAENDRHGAILNDVDAEREAQGDSFSKSINETVNGSHRFEIKGYSLAKGMGIGKYISSDTFTVGGFDWAIYFYPDGKNQEDNSQHVSIFIALASEGTDVRALFELTLLDQSGKGKHKVHSHFDRGLESGPYTLKYRGSMWGYKRYLKRVNLESSDYIKDDCLVMLCTVGVVRTRIEGPKQYVLPVPPSDIGESLHELLESEIGCDVEFEVGGETFRAHKLVLASRSTVFRSDFFGVSGDSNSADKVVLEGIHPYIFKAMLGFIYSDKLPETAAAPSGSCTGAGAGNSEGAMTSFIQKVLAVADRFNVERLKLLCEAKLSEQLNVGTAATTLALADHHGCLNLKDSCLKFSASHLTGVMRTQGFRHLEESCPSLLSELLGAIGGSVEEPMSRKRSGSSSIFGVDTAGDGGGGAAESVEPNSRRLRRRL